MRSEAPEHRSIPRNGWSGAQAVRVGGLPAIHFSSLLTITNMPISRFADFLQRRGELEEYMALLVRSFNPAAVPVCRNVLLLRFTPTYQPLSKSDFLALMKKNEGVRGGFTAAKTPQLIFRSFLI